LPELPGAKIERYRREYGLSDYDARVLAAEREVAEWFETAVSQAADPQSVANWMINQLFALMNEYKQTIGQIKVTPAGLVELIALVDEGTINANTAKEVLAEMYAAGDAPGAIVEAQGLAQISDEAALSSIIAQVMADNPEQVAAYRAGKTKLHGWFMGQVMRATQGQADPALVNRLLAQRLPSE
jgi:aspartyl-tRNA(Asn)/glutamyl-tRNA(Gln) amidotransferase subunit B